jgi:hypothetical protein
MEEQIVKTDRINTYSNSNESKYPKDALSLPLITSNLSSELNRQNSLNKIDKNKIGQKRGFKKVGKKKRIVTARSSNQKRRFKINKDLDLVYKLNMEVDVDQIFKDDLQLRKEREKIDNSPDIMARRLNAYKHGSDKKNEKKMEVDSKEKEKYIEKEFKDELEVLENIKKDCNIINMHINQIRELIDEYKLEINVYNNYGDEMEKKYLKEVKEKEKEKNKLELLNNINNINNEVLEQSNENDEEEEGGNNKNNNENDVGNMGLPIKNSKQEKYEYINNAFNMMRRKKEERLKFIKESIIQKEEELKSLEEQQKKLIGKCKEKKNGIYKLRQQLLNIYHINLYEGLNFRTDGLATLIRSIWNLGVNVDINYMPTYLDNLSIDYLFDRTKRLIEISKMRQIIDENEKEFEAGLNQWKQMANVNENSKDSEGGTNSNFFQTGVMEKYNYLDKYPKSKQFMEDYNKKYFSKNDKIEINLKQKNVFKSRNIPFALIDKYNKIEKLKYLLKNLIEQNDNKEKKEIQRLCKEFLNNDYEKKYQVSVETIMGALCGEEKKNEGINYFAKYQREYKEGKKLIQFHKNFNRFAQK